MNEMTAVDLVKVLNDIKSLLRIMTKIVNNRYDAGYEDYLDSI